MAAERLLDEKHSKTNLVFLTDSLTALESLMSGPTDLFTRQLHNSLSTLCQNNQVVLQWIPAHIGIAGNEEADSLAKDGSQLPQFHTSTSYREAKTLLRRKQQPQWKQSLNGYSPRKDQINSLDRRSQTTIFRLRTGHCGLNKHLKRLGLARSAHCDCGAEETNSGTPPSNLPTL